MEVASMSLGCFLFRFVEVTCYYLINQVGEDYGSLFEIE